MKIAIYFIIEKKDIVNWSIAIIEDVSLIGSWCRDIKDIQILWSLEFLAFLIRILFSYQNIWCFSVMFIKKSDMINAQFFFLLLYKLIQIKAKVHLYFCKNERLRQFLSKLLYFSLRLPFFFQYVVMVSIQVFPLLSIKFGFFVSCGNWRKVFTEC